MKGYMVLLYCPGQEAGWSKVYPTLDEAAAFARGWSVGKGAPSDIHVCFIEVAREVPPSEVQVFLSDGTLEEETTI